MVLFDSGNPVWLFSCLFVDSPYLMIRCPRTCSSPRPPDVYLFIWLHQVLVEALGLFSLQCSMWGLQPWHVGSSAVACGIQFPEQVLNPVPLHWELRALATGITREVPPPGHFELLVSKDQQVKGIILLVEYV